MKAIRVNQYGEADVLTLENIPIPKPGPGEVLVKIKAAGVNYIDIYMRSGVPRVSIPTPFTPGREGSGIVEGVGQGVSGFQYGDRVAYAGQIGSYAEYTLVDASLLIPLPKDISFEQGAAFPLQGITAHYLVHDYYPIKPGTNVLVHAAAGGVGLLLVQWLKKLGARVIGTTSTEEKAQIAKTNGADEVIIYTQEDFVAKSKALTNNKGVDYIIDGVGKETFTKDLEAVRTGGWICLFGSASGPADTFPPNLLQGRSLTVSGGNLFTHLSSRQELLKRANDVMDGIRAGWLNIKCDHVFSLEDAVAAQRLLESRKTTGKVILTTE